MQNLTSTIENQYEVTVEKIYEIPFGYSNKNFKVVSGKGDYVCRLSPLTKLCHLKMELNVLSQLESRDLGFKVPKNVKTKNEKDFIVLDNEEGIVTLFEQIRGYNASLRYPQKEKFQNDFARKVGKLHESLTDVKVEKTNHTHENLVQSYEDKFNQYAASPIKLEWQRLLSHEIPSIMDEIAKYKYYFHRDSASQRLVHTDLRLENAMLKNNKIVGIVDFDDIIMGSQAYDLSKIMVENFGNRDSNSNRLKQLIDLNGFENFARTYNESREITNQSFMEEVADLVTLPAIHVLSLVGRDPDFDDNQRTKNVVWYSNVLRVMRDKKNSETIRYNLASIQKDRSKQT